MVFPFVFFSKSCISPGEASVRVTKSSLSLPCRTKQVLFPDPGKFNHSL